MIAAWMLYAAIVSGLVTLAAAAVERIAAARGWPVRFIWLAALVLSILWPAGNAVRRLMPARDAQSTMLPFAITLQPVVSTATANDADRAAKLDRALVAFWVAVTALLLVRLGQGVARLSRTRAAWPVGDVDGTSVRLSENVGPAVVGLRSMDVVLPGWILALEPHLRAIVLRHEHEHREARDPYLLFAAGIAVALMPWNVALWFQARRLRLAIELDCDGRVLRAHPSTERYGMLMLTIAQRRSATPMMFAPMLSEPTTQLERRIIAMRTKTQRLARVSVVAGSTIAACALLFACALETDSPTGPQPSAQRSAQGRPTPVGLEQTYFEFQVEKAVSTRPGNPAPRYPDLLRDAEVTGEVLAQFVVDTMGLPDMRTFKVLKSSHDLFTASVRATLPSTQFFPAQVGGRPVKQLVQMPFQFSLARDASAQAKGATGLREVPVKAGGASTSGPARLQEVNITGVRRDTTKHDYVEFRIDHPATPKANNPAPRYPDHLRAANVEGEVVAMFVVDENGHADPATLKVVSSSHPDFTNAVRSSLPNMQFDPALVGGRAVKQLLRMPFTFSLSK